MTTALVRGVAPSFHRALTRQTGSAIDVDRARVQHARYVQWLRDRVDSLIEIPEDEAFPDCCFVEDTVVMVGGHALLTRPGAPSRRGEVEAVRGALPPRCRIVEPPEDIRLDGGDVLRISKNLFVGQSGRTNAAGLAYLRRYAEPLGLTVTEVPVAKALHLKCHCTALDADRVIVAEGFVPPSTFDGLAEVVWVPAAEAYAANVVCIGDQALVAEGFPQVAQALIGAGFEVSAVDVSEFAKADGSLTCLSVIVYPW